MCQAADAIRAARLTEARTRTERPVRRAPRAASGPNHLVLLGTAGGGNPKSTRFGYSNAVVVGDAAYIVDCGEGAHTQAWRAGIGAHDRRRPPGGATVRAVCLTHLHSDHVIDFANFMFGLWPAHDIDVFGPGPAGLPITAYPPGRVPELAFPDDPTPGTRAMVEHLFRAFAYNINVRIADEGRHDVTSHVKLREIGVARDGYRPDIELGVIASGATAQSAAPAMEPVEIRALDGNGVRVTAILVQHAPVFPALAYRFDTPTGSVVFSGDTGPCDNVVRLARGADVLVHEVIDVDYLAARMGDLPNREAVLAHLSVSHTAPAAAADVAQRAGVRTLVMSHLVPGDDEFSEAEWEAKAGEAFAGEIVCGVDLDRFALDSSLTG